uniref:Uncharacterized protein n=1 Tax=Bubo bubo TaxID=30461 RepID=A0A8C0ET93_BUBBB
MNLSINLIAKLILFSDDEIPIPFHEGLCNSCQSLLLVSHMLPLIFTSLPQIQRQSSKKCINSCRRSFLSYTSHSSWSLTEMAAAGFYHTLVKSSVQWFCSGLHQKFCPACGFVLEVGNISKYDICVQKLERNPAEYACRYYAKNASRWPFYARGTKPSSLARAGFFFTAFEPSVFFAQKLHLFEL